MYERRAPAAIPATLSLKEATGVCSGSATAFNVNSTSFESSKLKFYREMLDGVHEKNNASTKQNAPKANGSGGLVFCCIYASSKTENTVVNQ